MMQRRTRSEAIRLMNQYSEEGRPYLFVIDFEEIACIVEPLDTIHPEECLYDFGSRTNVRKERESLPPFHWSHEPYPLKSYADAFHRVVGHLRRGDSFLTNLTCRVKVKTDLPLRTIFLHAQAPYRLWLRDELVCFSPEPFVSVTDGVIRSFPMKGTIDAHLPDAEACLMGNEKEAAEHATIVDLIRNDLSRISERVRVERYRYVETLHNHRGSILQTSSVIAGQLPSDYGRRWGSLFFEMLPAGSISGAPKKRTVEIIREAEGESRGYYTGVMGWSDGKEVESAVMIRFIEKDASGELFYRAGGGITAMSRLEDEYEEINQKVYVPIY